MLLSAGTATQLAERLRALAEFGSSKRPAADSVLAQAVADARAYADYLAQDVAPQAANVVIVPGTSIFETADALASMIVDEAGDPSSQAPSAPFPWLMVGGAACLIAALVLIGTHGKHGGVLAEVGS